MEKIKQPKNANEDCKNMHIADFTSLLLLLFEFEMQGRAKREEKV